MGQEKFKQSISDWPYQLNSERQSKLFFFPLQNVVAGLPYSKQTLQIKLLKNQDDIYKFLLLVKWEYTQRYYTFKM